MKITFIMYEEGRNVLYTNNEKENRKKWNSKEILSGLLGIYIL